MPFTLRQLQQHIKGYFLAPRPWLVMLAMTVLLVLLSPFGTHEVLKPFALKLVYWGGIMLASWLLVVPILAISDFVAQRISWLQSLPWLIVMAGGLLIAAAPVSLVVMVMSDAILTPRLSQPPEPLQFWRLLPSVFAMGCIFAVLISLTLSASKQTQTEADVPQANTPQPDTHPRQDCPLLSRLPHDKRGTVLRLQVEDHYVRVTTDQGEHMVLMRLRDAIAALNRGRGLQVHRSHWVAYEHMKRLQRSGDRWVLTTQDDTPVPVSRSYLEQVKTAVSPTQG